MPAKSVRFGWIVMRSPIANTRRSSTLVAMRTVNTGTAICRGRPRRRSPGRTRWRASSIALDVQARPHGSWARSPRDTPTSPLAASAGTKRRPSPPLPASHCQRCISGAWLRTSPGPAACSANILVHSTFNSTAPTAVGTLNNIGPYGQFDMAGNVKEWCWKRIARPAHDSRRWFQRSEIYL